MKMYEMGEGELLYSERQKKFSKYSFWFLFMYITFSPIWLTHKSLPVPRNGATKYMWRWCSKLTYFYVFLWLFDFLHWVVFVFFLICNLHMITRIVCWHYFQNNHNQRNAYNTHFFSLAKLAKCSVIWLKREVLEKFYKKTQSHVFF